jgi:hypothetical protein
MPCSMASWSGFGGRAANMIGPSYGRVATGSGS